MPWVRRSFTLVEAVFAMILVATMLVAALHVSGAAVSGRARNDDRQRGLQLAEDLLAEIMQQAYAEPDGLDALRGTIFESGSAGASLGTDTGELTSSRAMFDDVDDYHGWSASPPEKRNGEVMSALGGWSRSVQVALVGRNDPGTIQANDTGVKRITVTVTHNDVTVAELRALRTLGGRDREACCLSDGSCLTVTRAKCLALGGEPRGAGTSCVYDGCESLTSLEVYFPFDSVSSGTSYDDSGQYVARLVNGATTGTGRSGSALRFDGYNDYAWIAHDDRMRVAEGTIAFWFRSDDIGDTAGLFSKASAGYDTGGQVLISQEAGQLRVRFESVASEITLAASGLASARWYHVALTFGPAGLKLYLDGAFVAGSSYTGGLGGTSGGAGNYEPIVLGASGRYSDDLLVTPLQDYFDGRIDELYMLDQALDAAAIAELSSEGSLGDTIGDILGGLGLGL